MSNVVDQVLAAMQAGRIADAISIGRKALEPFGPIAEHAFAAGISLARGEPDAAPADAMGLLRMLAAAEVASEGFRRLREGLGITRKELATKLGIGVSVVGHYESGRVPIPPEAIFQLMLLAGDKVAEVRTYAPITGTELRAIRLGLDFSVARFAETLGIPEASLDAWERRYHDRPIPSKAMQRIGPALDKLKAAA